MNDLELLDKFCDTCLDFICPFTFREIEKRGLTWAVNLLPNNATEARAIVRSRLAKVGRTFGDAEIDQIANEIKRVEALKTELNNVNLADAHKVLPILEKMMQHSEFILNYYKEIQIP